MSGTAGATERLVAKLGELPPDKLIEVEDFVDFLRQRTEERLLVATSVRAGEAAFEQVWDNLDDAVYDRL
ncbi:MAG TPA: hypothetical protein VFG43_07915 [Geminicoccaceae bacterium]|nr:hypothetical protein [Geminicoccaceae bacterium]